MKSTFAIGAAIAFSPADKAGAAGASLECKHFPAGPNGFFRAPVLVSGPIEAVLIDGGFTLPDGKALAEAINAKGKKLTTIYISQSDPDYYFSLRPVVEAFPEARVIAASATIEAIKANVQKKLDTWGPQLKENGPQKLEDVVFATAYDEPTLTVDGQVIEIVKAEGLENRRYLWVPSLQAVFGGVLIFNGTHVWTADTPTKEARAAWIKVLDGIIARKPAVVVAGHTAPEAATDLSGVEHTRAYLLAFEEELAKAKTGAELNAAMKSRFPGLGMEVAIDIGAKVATGEMKWG